jgi:hypothetical protein
MLENLSNKNHQVYQSEIIINQYNYHFIYIYIKSRALPYRWMDAFYIPAKNKQ